MDKKPVIVDASACLYGTNAIGFAALVVIPGKPIISLGFKDDASGAPGKYGSMTEAIFGVCEALSANGISYGKVVVSAPGGELQATVDISNPKWAGDLAWGAAPVYSIAI